MRTRTSVVAALFLTAITLAASSAAKVGVELKDAQGKSVGSALMYESDGMVTVVAACHIASTRSRGLPIETVHF